jgi:hypothetical protein
MLIGLLRLCLMAGLWCAALWYALPLDLAALSPPDLVGLHVAPPLLAEAAWFAFKRIRAARAEKAKDAAEKTAEAEKQAEIEAAEVAREEALRRRRAYVECRALWLEVIKIPDWLKEVPTQCSLVERQVQEVQGRRSETVLLRALQEVFEVVLSNEPLAWLPVYLLAGRDLENDARRLKWLRQAWQKAAVVRGTETRCQCEMLPGEGAVAERVISMFESDSELPALILLGMDSPLVEELGGAEEADGDLQQRNVQGHAIVAALLSRPGLALPEDMKAAAVEHKEADDYTPYWERGDMSAARSAAGWGEMPLRLQPVFLESLKPFAALCRSRQTVCPERGYMRALKETIENVSIDAGLLKMPGERERNEESPDAKTPESLDLGGLLHNSGEGDDQDAFARRARLVSGMTGLGCEIDVLEEASNLDEEHGDVGAAYAALMLAEALIRAAQLQKPVLTAEFGENDEVVVGMAWPVPAKL